MSDTAKNIDPDIATNFLQKVARLRLSSEFSDNEKPANPMKVLDSLVMEARELSEGEHWEECGMDDE